MFLKILHTVFSHLVVACVSVAFFEIKLKKCQRRPMLSLGSRPKAKESKSIIAKSLKKYGNLHMYIHI